MADTSENRNFFRTAGPSLVAIAMLGVYLLFRAMATDASTERAVRHETKRNPAMSLATFGAGCFWGVEAAYRKLDGVTATSVGYAGGQVDHATYKQVCGGDTGHAEVVQVEYDPSIVSYDSLLDTFWQCHDPTQHNRQGPDVGTQYRSVIFYHDTDQETAARASMNRLQSSGAFAKPIATQLAPAAPFWMAEDYHQQYLEKRGLDHCRL